MADLNLLVSALHTYNDLFCRLFFTLAVCACSAGSHCIALLSTIQNRECNNYYDCNFAPHVCNRALGTPFGCIAVVCSRPNPWTRSSSNRLIAQTRMSLLYSPGRTFTRRRTLYTRCDSLVICFAVRILTLYLTSFYRALSGRYWSWRRSRHTSKAKSRS